MIGKPPVGLDAAIHPQGDGSPSGCTRRGVVILLFVFSVLLLRVGLGGVWATPDQDPRRQTLPTDTPSSPPPGCPSGSALLPRMVTITVDLQRPAAPPPDPSWAVPVHLSLHPCGDAGTVCYQWDLTLDHNGTWSGELDVYTGLYDVRLKNVHTLRNVRRGVEISTTNSIDLGTLLEGDASGDNYVKGDDFSILRTVYFKQEGQAGFDSRADFDEDGWVKGSDFSLLRTNYWKQGDIVAGPVDAVRAAPPAPSCLRPFGPAAFTGAGERRGAPKPGRPDELGMKGADAGS